MPNCRASVSDASPNRRDELVSAHYRFLSFFIERWRLDVEHWTFAPKLSVINMSDSQTTTELPQREKLTKKAIIAQDEGGSAAPSGDANRRDELVSFPLSSELDVGR